VQAGSGFDLRQRHNRINFLNPRHHRQLFKEKPLIGLDVRGDDTQQKIHRPHQHITLQHFRKPANRVGELGEVGATVGVEFHLGENLRVEADLLAVQQGHLTANHALFLEPLDPSPARRLRQADLFGDLRAGERGVFLQQGQDTAVVGVQLAVHINTFYCAYLELYDSINRTKGSS